MAIHDLIGFRRDRFFEGAVQLGWLASAPARAALAARSYVFHGPALHGVGRRDHADSAGAAALQDTATFVRDVVRRVTAGAGSPDVNPFGLAIAGYGTGKSHLGVTLAQLLGGEPEVAAEILDRLEVAAPGLGEASRADLARAGAPVLVVALDGMGDFNLGQALYHQIVEKLRRAGCDLGPVNDLSPRFERAEAFVERNFDGRVGEFEQAFGEDCGAADIVARLRRRDEGAYQAVDGIFAEVTGAPIPVSGQESPEALITTVCDHYMGPGKPFASLLVLFDEFGRFLEFAADKPQLAGDAALQQIYQGVQTAGAAGRCYFLGLIQFDLKTYISQLEKREAHHLMRFVPRYDYATKTLLSSNLETLFASLIERRQPEAVQALFASPAAEAHWADLRRIMARALPGFGRWEVWADPARFRSVVVEGCWPLHPTAVWFLARLDGVVQSRSALSFVAEAVDRIGPLEPTRADGLPESIHPVDLVLGPMLGELLEAERRMHGTVVATFAQIREKHAGKWTPEQERAVAAIVVAQKMRANSATEAEARELLAALAGIPAPTFARVLTEVIDTYAVAEWNEDLKHFDLIIDGVPRSHFTLFLRKRAKELATGRVLAYFRDHGPEACALKEPVVGFGSEHAIDTPDWRYEIVGTTPDDLLKDVKAAVEAWRVAITPDAAKGRLLYCLVPADADLELVAERFRSALLSASKTPVPVFGVLLADESGELIEDLARLAVLDNLLTKEEQGKYGAFIEAEHHTVAARLGQRATDALAAHRYVLPDGATVTAGRLNLVANSLFEAVYPAAMPFPFEGFLTTTRGAAAKDAALITRALATGSLDGNWLSTAMPQTRNRARALLVKAWRVLSEDHRTQREPRFTPLRTLLAGWAGRLEAEGELDLRALLAELLAPPYGFNLASGGAVLAAFLGGETPMKSLVDERQPITADDWLNRVYGKGTAIDPAKVKGTRVRFVEAEAAQEWKDVAWLWVSERAHRKIMALAERSEKLKKRCPMPAERHEEERVFAERVAGSRVALQVLDKELDEWRQRCERARGGRNMGMVLHVASLTIKKRADLARDPDFWTAEDLGQLDRLLEFCRSEVDAHFERSLPDMWPKDVSELGAFQTKTKLYAKSLGDLGRPEFQQKLEKHAKYADERILVRLRNEQAVEAAKAFLATAHGHDGTASSLLSRWTEEGARHAEAMRDIVRMEQEAQGLVESLEGNLATWRGLLADRRSALKALAGTESFATLAALQEAHASAERLHATVDGGPDQDFARDLAAQLAAAIADWRDLADFTGALDELAGLVATRASERTRAVTEAGSEPYWDFSELYAGLAEGLRQELADRGEAWLARVVPEPKAVSRWPATRCRDALEALGRHPAYLDDLTTKAVAKLAAALRTRLGTIEEEDRHQQAHGWLAANVPTDPEMAGYDAERCRVALERIARLPAFLGPDELAQIASTREALQLRLDNLDFSQLVERARRLPVARRRELVEMLQSEIAQGR